MLQIVLLKQAGRSCTGPVSEHARKVQAGTASARAEPECRDSCMGRSALWCYAACGSPATSTRLHCPCLHFPDPE